MKKLKLALAYFLLPAAGIAISFESYAVSCGDTITSQETLTQDLVCATNPALTITGPLGGLDMDGFTVTCSASTDDGILLNGLSASLTSGVIDNCNNSIMLQDDGSHYVTSVDIDDPDGVGVLISSDSNFVTGIQIQSDGVTSGNGIETEDPANYNQIIGNTIDSTGGDGIYLEGISNNVTSNIITNAGGDGVDFDPDGRSNILILNVIDNSTDVGIEIDSNSNLISQNVVTNNVTGIRVESADNNTISVNSVSDNNDYGISIESGSADGNTVLSNSSLNNGIFDLYSPNDPTCTDNTWIGNTFVTRDPSCLE